MDHKENIHELIKKISMEVLAFIKEEESKFDDNWVPAVHIKNMLDLEFIDVPKANKQYGKRGWFFAIIARKLEDQNLIEYSKDRNAAFCRSI